MKVMSALGALIAAAIFCGALGVALVSGPDPAPGGEVCAMTTAQANEEVQAAHLGAVEYRGTRFTALFNAIQEEFGPAPETFAGVNSLLVVDMGEQGTVLIGFFKNDCLVGRSVVPTGLMSAILRKAFGTGV